MRDYIALPFFLLVSLSTNIAFSNELQTVQIQLLKTPLEQVLDGTIEAINQSTVSAEISGRITEINFDVDNLVNKGDVLIRVRDNEYQARLNKAEANYSEAQVQFQDAQLEFERAKDMFKKNVISESQHDRASANLKAAEARVAAGKAAVAEAKEQLENTTVRAPYSGVVSKRHVELGESVSPGKPLMTGLSMDQLRAVVNVPQSFINAIRKHQQARIILLDDDRTIASDSLTIFPYADSERHTFQTRVNLPENLKNIYPGMLVKVAFVIDDAKRLMIPRDALVQRSEVNAVYVVDEAGKVKMRQVRIGHSNQDQVEIIAGLDAGETIALDPVQAGITLKGQTGDKQ